jgi:hypothetical protein
LQPEQLAARAARVESRGNAALVGEHVGGIDEVMIDEVMAQAG